MYDYIRGLISLVGLLIVLILGILLYTLFDLHWQLDLSPFINKPIESSVVYFDETNDEYSLLKLDEGVDLIRKHCLSCHSARIIAQTKLDEEAWRKNIDWMQRTQGLWQLGKDHEPIIRYLATNYAPEAKGRRSNLKQASIEWYQLNE